MFLLVFSCFIALTWANIKQLNAARRGRITLLGNPAMPRLNLTQKAIAKLAAPHPDRKQTVY